MPLTDIIDEIRSLRAHYLNIDNNDNKDEFIPYILKVENNDAKHEKSFKINKLTGTEVIRYDNIPYVAVMMPKKDNINLLAKDIKSNNYWKSRKYSLNPIMPPFERIAIVRKIEENRWNLNNIQTYLSWQFSKGENIKVGIIDTGVDYEHSELRDKFTDFKGYNFIRGNYNPMDDNSHGTHVAGIIAGETTGVAPKATLYALKVLNANGTGYEHHILQAIDWSITNGMDIINMSLGSNSYSPAEEEICRAAYRRGISIVAAAGNDGEPIYSYPASLPGVISVAAVDRFNNHAYFSNINDMVDISAPGVDIYSTIPDEKYAIYSGTSMATPHISGSLALIKSYTRQNNEELEKEIKNHAKYLGKRLEYGAGIVQVYDALMR